MTAWLLTFGPIFGCIDIFLSVVLVVTIGRDRRRRKPQFAELLTLRKRAERREAEALGDLQIVAHAQVLAQTLSRYTERAGCPHNHPLWINTKHPALAELVAACRAAEALRLNTEVFG